MKQFAALQWVDCGLKSLAFAGFWWKVPPIIALARTGRLADILAA